MAGDSSQDFGRTPALAPVFARLRARLEPRPPSKLVAVGGCHDGDGWKVLLLGGGDVLAALDPEAGRELAAEILATCELLEGGKW